MIDVIIAHLVGDFLLQNDYIATNKKLSHKICVLHSIIIGILIYVLADIPLMDIITITILHFIQDRWNLVQKYMRLIGQDRFLEEMGPWSAIIVDQVFHILIIYLVIT